MGVRVAFITGPDENIGIKYLSAILKENGHATELFFDPQLFNDEIISIRPLSKIFDLRENLIKDIVDYNPALIGFSVLTDFYEWAYELAARIKKKINTPIIFGGIHPTSVPNDVIKCDAVDMICIGEGEHAILELADSLESGVTRVDIKNIWFKKNGQIFKNPPRPLADLNCLPRPDHDIYYRKNKIFRIGYHTAASRGCPYRCSYCCHSVLKSFYGEGNYYRVRNVRSVIEELKDNLKEYKFKIVRFYDDIFPYDLKWLKEFSDLYSRQVNRPFICYLHPGLVDEDRVSLLRRAGCSEIRLGVQTLNQKIREEILSRHESNDVIERALNVIKKNRIKVVTENMLGLPRQNEHDIRHMLQFYSKNRTNRNHFFWLRYYPGIEIEKSSIQNRTGEQGRKWDNKVFTRGGDTYRKNGNKLILGLYSLSWMPERIVRFFTNANIWLYLPSLPLVFLNIFANLTSQSDSDRIGRSRMVARYRFYLFRFLKIKFNRGFYFYYV